MSLEACAVTFAYPRNEPVIHDISLALDPGETVVLVGANGSGKSTLLRVLSGYLCPQSGTVHLKGRMIHRLSAQHIARRVASLEQQPTMALDFTVREIVEMGRLPHLGPLRRMKTADHRAVTDALLMTNTAELADRSIHALSGGEQQRAFLAMAFAQSPDVLLLDEPTRHLDVHYQIETMELIRQRAAAGLSVLVALHDLNHAAAYGDRVAVMHHGRLRVVGPPESVLSESLIREAFNLACHVVDVPSLDRRLIVPVEPRNDLSQ